MSNGGQWTTQVLTTYPNTFVANGTVCLKDAPAGLGSAWWNVSTFGPDMAMAITMPSTSTLPSQLFGLFLRLVQPGVADQTDGYSCVIVFPDEEISLARRDNSAFTEIANCPTLSAAVNDGDSFACEMIGPALKAYVDRGTGWVEECSATDGTYTGAGYGGMNASHFDLTADTIRLGTITGSAVATGEGLFPILQ